MKKAILFSLISLLGMPLLYSADLKPRIFQTKQERAKRFAVSPYVVSQWGWNGWLNNNNPDLGVKWFPGIWPASGWNMYLMFGKGLVDRRSHELAIGLGIGPGNSKYKFKKENLVMARDDQRFSYTFESDSVAALTNREYIKSKLSLRYIDIPFDVYYKYRDLEITFSFKVGYMYDLVWKRKFKDYGDRDKQKVKADFGLEKLRYGASVRLHYKEGGVFFYYELSPQFKDPSMPQNMTPIMIGFSRSVGNPVKMKSKKALKRIDLMDVGAL